MTYLRSWFWFTSVCLTLIPCVPCAVHAVAPEENRLAVGQGIASPAATSFVNYSRGFTSGNAAGVMYQDGFRLSGELDRDGVNDMGFEGGYTGKQYGFAAGMYEPGCPGCKSTMTGILGADIGKSAAIGARYSTTNNQPTYSLGLMVNPRGTNRLGLNVDYLVPSTSPSYSTTSIGAGYAYVTKGNTIALEASKQQFQDPSITTGSQITASVSYQKRVDPLMVSLSYEKVLNAPSTAPDTFWMGAGFDSPNLNFCIYSNYKQDMLAVLTGFF